MKIKLFFQFVAISVVTVAIASPLANYATSIKRSASNEQTLPHQKQPNASDSIQAQAARAPRVSSAPNWIEQLGTQDGDFAEDIAADRMGNIYIMGGTTGKLGDQQYGDHDVWLGKYNSTGQLQWLKQFGTKYGDNVGGIATDGKGYIYIGGYTQKKRFYPFLAKYSSTGNLLWTQQLLEPSIGYALSYITGVASDAKGNAYLAGGKDNKVGVAKYNVDGKFQWVQSFSIADFNGVSGIAVDMLGNVYIKASSNDQLFRKFDTWVAKYGPGGQLQWIKHLSSANYDNYEFNANIATDTSGNFYVTGSTRDQLGDQKYGSFDAWVAKYNSDGEVQWIKQLGTSFWDKATSIATDNKTGNVYVAGRTRGGKLGDQQYGKYDAWVAKYSTTGVLRWVKQLGTADIDGAFGVAADGVGNVYITGDTLGKLGDQQYGGGDAWIAKYRR